VDILEAPPGPARAPAPPVPSVQSLDYVRPAEVVEEAARAAAVKAALPVPDLLIRGFLSGAFLGVVTSLALTVKAQALPAIAGAVIFPVGFVLLVLLGLELATGSFALLPLGLAARTASWSGLARNWVWVYLGNLAGCVFYAALFYAALTSFGHTSGGPVAAQIRASALAKTTAYSKLGAQGWWLALLKGILANWMVTVGVIMALVTRSTIAKIAAMWLPIMTFFALGFEHSVVNMFIIPAGMFLKAPISFGDWWFWNQIPVTIGNVIGGAVLTGLALYATFGRQERVDATG